MSLKMTEQIMQRNNKVKGIITVIYMLWSLEAITIIGENGKNSEMIIATDNRVDG